MEHACRTDRAVLLTTSAAEYFPRFGFRTGERNQVPAELQACVEFASACPATATVMHLSLAGGEALRDLVRLKYGAAALRANRGEASNCGCGCGPSAETWDPITSNL